MLEFNLQQDQPFGTTLAGSDRPPELTIPVARPSHATAGQCALSSQSASSRGVRRWWPASIRDTPARRHIATGRPGTTGCSPPRGPDPSLSAERDQSVLDATHIRRQQRSEAPSSGGVSLRGQYPTLWFTARVGLSNQVQGTDLASIEVQVVNWAWARSLPGRRESQMISNFSKPDLSKLYQQKL